MAKASSAYQDNKGGFHPSPEAAVLSDIATALGRVGDEGGLTAGVAKLILDRRAEIETAFSELDAMKEGNPND